MGSPRPSWDGIRFVAKCTKIEGNKITLEIEKPEDGPKYFEEGTRYVSHTTPVSTDGDDSVGVGKDNPG